MNSPRDYENKMATHLRPADDGDVPDVVAELLRDDVLRAAGYDDDVELAAILRAVHGLGQVAPPRPSDDLAAMMEVDGAGQFVGRRSPRHRKTIVAVMAGGALSLGLTGVAAANDRLPGRAQQVVAGVVNDLTPFRINSGDPTAVPVRGPERSASTHSSAPGGSTSTRPTPSDSESASTSARPGGDETSSPAERTSPGTDETPGAAPVGGRLGTAQPTNGTENGDDATTAAHPRTTAAPTTRAGTIAPSEGEPPESNPPNHRTPSSTPTPASEGD